MIQIAVLAENSVESSNLMAEHGWACWIKTDSQQLLFDTGQGLVLQHNARRMKIACQHAETIVLSHGHYDHTGGLTRVLEGRRGVSIYGHPACTRQRYVRTVTGTARDVGMPDAARRAVLPGAHHWHPTTAPTRLGARLALTGPVPRVNDFEDTGGSFYLDEQYRQVDPLEDDQALYFTTSGGTVVLLGCAHAGVINTLSYVQQLTDGAAIRMVIGGMHLADASASRLSHTIAALGELGVQQVAPGHCTGKLAWAALRSALGDRCLSCHVGTRWEFP